ncbi:MAG: hypothetical protein Q4D06_09215 [Coriobacteriia bacterium]|nr:hypothetical protein [Coriobacteriia bacterium]
MIKSPAMRGTATAFALCLAASAALTLGVATDAQARTFQFDPDDPEPEATMKLGEVANSGFKPGSLSGDDFAYMRIGDDSVVKVVFNAYDDAYERAYVVGLKPGRTYVELGVASLASADPGPDTGEVDPYVQRLYTGSGWETGIIDERSRYAFEVTVSKSGVIETAQCDGLFAGVSMGTSTLYNDYDFREKFFGNIRNGVYKPFLAKSGTLLKGGINSKASSTGRSVKFGQAGKASFTAVREGKAYKVDVAKVHSKAATRAALEKKLKAKYKSYRYVKGSAKLYKSKALNNRYALKMQYQVKSRGKYVTRTASAWFKNGTLKHYATRLV